MTNISNILPLVLFHVLTKEQYIINYNNYNISSNRKYKNILKYSKGLLFSMLKKGLINDRTLSSAKNKILR